MDFRKLKKWFQRRRRGDRGRAVASPASRASGQTRAPANVSGRKTDGDRSSPAPKAVKKTAVNPAAGKKKAPTGSAPEKHRERPISRRGIPILKPDEDLAAHFRDEAAEDAVLDPEAGTAGQSGGGKTGRPSPPSPRKSKPRSRLGIRRLEDDADLHAAFLAVDHKPPDEAVPGTSETPAPMQGAPPRMAAIPTNRHGIPRLDSQADLQRLFDATVEDPDDGEHLGETLHQSLAHDARSLMKKKTGGFFPTRRLSLKEKLRRYPDPQAQLDLHGATAARARERAAAYIRTAQADGLYTLRIIVGKGLHSEGGAVLPDVIEDLLLELKRDDIVLSYRWVKRVKRKSGAVIVFLSSAFQ